MWTDLWKPSTYAHNDKAQFHCQSIALSISKLTTTDTLPKVNKSAFAGTAFWGTSGIHWCLDGLETTVTTLNKQALGHRSTHYWLLLSIGFATFKHKRTSFETIWRSNFFMCFSLPLLWLPTTTTPNQPSLSKHLWYWWKLSKMAGNSASYSLKSSWTEISLVTVQQWRIACKQLHAFLRYNLLNYVFLNIYPCA